MTKKLDIYQKNAVENSDKYTLLIAPAGSGKTFTIVEKINYLIKDKNIKESEILCISFTNKSTNSLKNRLKDYGYNIDCFTFHKLSLNILKSEYYTAQNDLLEYIINEYLKYLIDSNNKKIILKYLKIKYNKYNYIKKYNSLNLDHLKKLIHRFITLFKSNDYDDKNFIDFINKEKNIKNKYFLALIFYIYKLYQLELVSKKEIDFNDMISIATKKVKESGFYKDLKYIFIDEFQDTSNVRFNLIKEILNKTKASLFAVGDDFQSIYRFTGCDLDLFLNFKNLFVNSKVITLNKTYRNSIELINISSDFILKNKNQIKKSIESDKSIKKPIIIIKYKNITKSFIKVINKIYNETNDPILVLSRNNFDISMLNKKLFYLEKDTLIYKNNPNIKMKYLTIHKAKGLEEENVIILNFKNSLLGFPNKISDNNILKYVTCKSDNFPFSEERRLLYVALTRTKNKVYLMCPKRNESIFIKELIKSYKIKKTKL